MCPECGGKTEVTTQDLSTGDVVYRCAAGHSWSGGEGPPFAVGRTEEKPKPVKPKKKT